MLIKNMQIENTSKWYLHPVFIFTCSIIALTTSLVLTTYWYMEITAALEIIIKKFHIDPKQIFPSKTGMIFIVLTLLVTVVLAGIFLAFVYYQRTVRLFRLQHNFIYNFTHELKTPVTSLKIYIETFLRHKIKEDDIKKYSKYMLDDIDRLIKNINSILNLAKIESQTYEAELSYEDLAQKAKEFCTKNQTLFRNCKINVITPEKTKTICQVNILLFEILLMNILSNAVKYNESKQPEINIYFRFYKKKIIVDFKDNGIGIEKKEIKKIFSKFYQIEKHENIDVKGTGLGLYLVSSIAKIHGWKIKAKSDGKKKGAVFTLSIPMENSIK